MAPSPKPLPFIKRVTSKGRFYEYFDTGKDVDGKRVYNRLPPRSDKSWGQVYAGMVAARTARANVAIVPTMADLSRRYQLDGKFTNRATSTQSTYLIYIRVIEAALGMARVNEVERRDVQALLDSMADRPGAANMTLLVLRNMFRYALKRQWIEVDPCAGVEELETGEAEHDPWPEPLLEDALADPEVRLAVALLYYTAQRIGDVCKVRWSDVRDGFLFVRQQKTGKELDIRLHRDLAEIMATVPKTAMTVLEGTKGRPMRVATLRLRLQAFAAKRGHAIVPHGLRKNAINALLEAGCSIGETASISGQSLSMVEHYAKKRNNKRMGSAAVLKWEGTKRGNGKPGKTA